MQHALDTLKAKRRETPHHITTGELPEEARFLQLSTRSKQLVDTIKMIAYRAETAIAKLCEELNATETIFPRTNLRLVMKMGST